MFHWIDLKIREHVFHRVLALAVARLTTREAKGVGISMSLPEPLDTLAAIQETVPLYKAERGRPRPPRMISEIGPTQRKLHGLFDLDAYAPKRWVRRYTAAAEIPLLA